MANTYIQINIHAIFSVKGRENILPKSTMRTFKEEYLDLLEKFKIDFDDNYLFEFYD